MEAYERYNRGSLLNERYSKVADISEGSYGLVSLAKDTKTNDTLVAVKYIFPADYKRAQTFREHSKATGRATSSPAKLRSNVDTRLRSQMAILNELCEESAKEIRIHNILGRHSNITSLIDHFGSCLVLEYCSRGDLYEAIQSDTGPSTSQDVKDVFGQILDALEFCHGKLVYHRDLKPENILITDDWTIKICDWGLATTERVISNRAEFDVGSERYMAPELFDPELESYDAAKVDLWSVGIILLTLVFHKNPFKAANYTDKRFLQYSANREALFDFFSVMSGDMFSALRLCLALDPQNRDLHDLREEVEKVRFFTVDEEYWATHSDEEDEDTETDAKPEVPYPETFNEPFSQPFHEPFAQPFAESFDQSYGKSEPFAAAKPAPEPKARAHFADVFDASDVDPHEPKARAHFVDVFDANDVDPREPESMPYNRRADALRLLYSGAEPIPIGRIRNTRKPFGVASYNRSAGRTAFSHNNGPGNFNNNFNSNFNGNYNGHNGSSYNGNVNGNWQNNSYNNNGNGGARFRREDFFTPRSVFNHYMDKYGENKEREKDAKRRRRGRKRQSWKKHHTPASALSSQMSGQAIPPDSGYTPQGSGHVLQTSGHAILGHALGGSAHTGFPPSAGSSVTDARRKATSRKRRSRFDVAQSVPMHATTSAGSIGMATSAGHGPSPGKYVPPFLRLPKSPAFNLLAEEIDHLTLDDDMFHLEDVGDHESGLASGRAFLGGTGILMEAGRSAGARRGLVPHGDGKYIPPFRRGSHLSAVREKRRLCNPGMFPSIQQTLEEKFLSVPDDDWMARKNWSEY